MVGVHIARPPGRHKPQAGDGRPIRARPRYAPRVSQSTVTFDAFLARLRAERDPAPPARYGPYRSYGALFAHARALCDETGAIAETFGRSAGGEPMWALRIGPTQNARRRVLFLANLHAQEFIGVEAALGCFARAARRIAAGDPRLAGIELTCVPTANPDGYRRVAAGVAAGDPRFRRKNERGVDLNRNFAEGWDKKAILPRLLPFIYDPGESPLSEPETAALDNLFSRRFDRAISFHSFGEWIFWPWAGRNIPTADEHRFAALATQMQRAMPRPYKAVQLGKWARWFRAGGAEIDHLYGRYGTLAYLIEVSGGGRRLFDWGRWTDAFAWFNPPDVEREVENVAGAAMVLVEGEDG